MAIDPEEPPTGEAPFAKPLASLPYLAQILVGCRLLRRAAQSMLVGLELEKVSTVCDSVELVCIQGSNSHILQSPFSTRELIDGSGANHRLADALDSLMTAAIAARRISQADDEMLVTSAIQRCMQQVFADPRLSLFQLAIIVNSDIGLISALCDEVDIGNRIGLGNDLMARLPPCHPLQLFEPPTSPEDAYR